MATTTVYRCQPAGSGASEAVAYRDAMQWLDEAITGHVSAM